jgi:transposase-like protein
LLAVFDFPADHWVHLRATNPIESIFATVRHRTSRTKNCFSRATFLGLAFKMSEEAAKTWRRIRAPEKRPHYSAEHVTKTQSSCVTTHRM